MFGLAGRFGRVESNAEHCQGGHSRATAMMEPCRDRTCRCSGDGFYQLRPSESPLATQRRTGSVVIRAGIGMAVTPLPVRRRPHSWPGEMTREGVARGSPVRHFVIREASRSRTPAKCRTRHPAARRYPAFCGGRANCRCSCRGRCSCRCTCRCACRCSGDRFYQLRPSESPLATQRRTGSVVIEAGLGMAVTTQPVRRRPHS